MPDYHRFELVFYIQDGPFGVLTDTPISTSHKNKKNAGLAFLVACSCALRVDNQWGN